MGVASLSVLEVPCGCGKTFVVPAWLQGRRLRCKRCGGVSQVEQHETWREGARFPVGPALSAFALAPSQASFVVRAPRPVLTASTPGEHPAAPASARPSSAERTAAGGTGHALHLRAIGVGYVVGGVLLSGLGLGLTPFAFTASPLLGASALLGVALAVLTVAVGVGLFRLTSYVRAVAMVLAGFAVTGASLVGLAGLGPLLIALPVAGWGLACLWALGSERCARALRSSEPVRSPWWTSGFLWIPAGAYLLGGLGGSVLVAARILSRLA